MRNVSATVLSTSSVSGAKRIGLVGPVARPTSVANADATCSATLANTRAIIAGVGTNGRDVLNDTTTYVRFDNTVVGTGAEVHWPAYSQVIDYELEIGVITARAGKNIKVEDADAWIFGYAIYNDFSARDAQYTEMAGALGPAKGKDFDTGNAMGPWLVTADEVPDPQALTMVTRVNGEEWSRGNSRDMQHSFKRMVSYMSEDETLYAGEVIGSGTVGGGCGNELGRFMKHGDEIELEVSGLGILKNRIVAPHVPVPPPFPIRIPV
jgi:2-keto-4-pentenoate hydratase/2-oxohepta-3-ene-1,7-dioic acid hydratase in catechol pathway